MAPTDPVVLTLKIEPALLPDWYDEVQTLAAGFVRRMGVIERPEGWIVQCELEPDRVEPFKQALNEAWEARRAREGETQAE